MYTITKDLRSATAVSLILVLPFVILEFLNNTVTRQNAPGLALLFGLMLLLPVAFIVIAMPIVRTVRAGNRLLESPITVFLRGSLLAVIATVWGWGVMDQLPCFLGVPNCD